MLDAFFRDQPQHWVQPHIDSYNEFLEKGLPAILQRANPISLSSRSQQSECQIYLGGLDGTFVEFQPPQLEGHRVVPNEARWRKMTYALSVFVDVDVEWTEWLAEGDKEPEYAKWLQPREQTTLSESQEEIVIRRHIEDDEHLGDLVRQRVHAELAKVTADKRRQTLDLLANDASLNAVDLKTTSKKVYKTTLKRVFLCHLPLMVQSKACLLSTLTSEMRFGLGECRHDLGGYFIIDGQDRGAGLLEQQQKRLYEIVIDASSGSVGVSFSHDAGKKPVPVFAVFRALNVDSDLAIIQYIVHDFARHDDLVDALAPSVYEGQGYEKKTDSEIAKDFLSKRGCPASLLLTMNPFQLGWDVFQSLSVSVRGIRGAQLNPPRRWTGLGGRVESLFQEEWIHQVDKIKTHFETVLQEHPADYETNLYAVVMDHYVEALKKVSVLEQLEDHLVPLETSSHVARLHQLRALGKGAPASYGYVDPFDQSLALSASVSTATDPTRVLAWFSAHLPTFGPLESFTPTLVADMTKIVLNGQWVGVVEEPEPSLRKFRVWRHNGLMPSTISMTFLPDENRLDVWCDAGRLLRPLCHSSSAAAAAAAATKDATWTQLLTGFHEKKKGFSQDRKQIYMSLSELYDTTETNPNRLARFDKEKSVVELLDEYESASAYISESPGGTHTEIHPSLFLGWSSHHVAFLEHQSSEDIRRTLSKMQEQHRLMGLSFSNASRVVVETNRSIVSGQAPTVKSPVTFDAKLTYGHNVVVAVGGNGSIWINEASLKRGLFAILQEDLGTGGTQDVSGHVICTTTQDGFPLIWHQSSKLETGSGVFTFRTGGGLTVSALVSPEADMPFLGLQGHRPDLVVSTDKVSLLYELFTGKFATVMGSSGNGMPLDSRAAASLGPQGRLLTAMGYHSSGNEIMYDGMTGRQMEVEVFLGIAFAMPLQTESLVRRRGRRDALTRQPVDDAPVLQEVDVLAMLGHGLGACTQDAMMTRGDATTLAVCNQTGCPAIQTRVGFFSPAVDGPLQVLDDNRVDYGKTTQKEFSVVQVPYAFKLLTQELMAMGVQMRLATDDQIDHLREQKWEEKKSLPKKPNLGDRINHRRRLVGGGGGFENVMHLLELKEGGAKASKSDDVPRKEDHHLSEGEEDIWGIRVLKQVEEQEEQEQANMREFRVGDKVCMRAVTDGYPARPWSIVRMGDAFLTVRALDPQQLAIKDQIRVVAKTDIMREAEIIAQKQLQQQQQQQQLLYGPPQQQQQQQQQPMVLNIAPKFVNGPDNSHVVPTVGQPMTMMDLGTAVAQPQPQQLVQQPPAPEKTTDDVDFSKGLIIVKKQS